MSRGRVKWFNNQRGYGFIEYSGLVNEDVFVHYTSIDQNGFKSLKQDELVDFRLIKTAKGCQAVDVKEIELKLL